MKPQQPQQISIESNPENLENVKIENEVTMVKNQIESQNISQSEIQENKIQVDIESNIEDLHLEIMRDGFVKKVYGILTCQLLITLITIGLTFIDIIKNVFTDTYISTIFEIVSLIGMIISLIIIACTKCYPTLKRFDYFLLFFFTLFMSASLMPLCSLYERKNVFIAVFMTFAVTFGITYYSCNHKDQFKYSIAFCYSLFTCIISSFLFFICGVIFNIIFNWGYILICFGSVILYSIYLLYDTRLILNKFNTEFLIDDYVMAALNIYIDIIYIFINILRILAKKK